MDSLKEEVYYSNLVPRKDKGPIRGDGLGVNGQFHDPSRHMEQFTDKPSIKLNADNNRATVHKLHMNSKILII